MLGGSGWLVLLAHLKAKKNYCGESCGQLFRARFRVVQFDEFPTLVPGARTRERNSSKRTQLGDAAGSTPFGRGRRPRSAGDDTERC